MCECVCVCARMRVGVGVFRVCMCVSVCVCVGFCKSLCIRAASHSSKTKHDQELLLVRSSG